MDCFGPWRLRRMPRLDMVRMGVSSSGARPVKNDIDHLMIGAHQV